VTNKESRHSEPEGRRISQTLRFAQSDRRKAQGGRRVRAIKQYYVYIMASRSKTLYTGVTDDLVKRVFEHKNKLIKGFTMKYNVTNLIYYDVVDDVQAAIQREKQVKGWLRRKKIALIETMNPEWKDLSDGWYKT
jgi:putative endonuclease